MKIKETITDQDLDSCYDLLILTTFIMFAMAVIAKVFAYV